MSLTKALGLTPEHFEAVAKMQADPSSFGFQNQFDYAKASGKDLVSRSKPGLGIVSLGGQVLGTPFYDTYSGIQRAKEPYEKDLTQFSGITDYDEMSVGPSLSEVYDSIRNERMGTMMAGRLVGGIDALRERNPGLTGTSYLDDVNISQAPGTNVGNVGKTLSGFAKSIGDLFSGSAVATETDLAKAIADRTALDRQGLMALDDAGLTTPAYEDFAQVARPGFNLGFAKQLGKQALTGILSAVNPVVGLIARGLSGMPGRVGIQGGVALREDTNLDTFARSTSLADFAQRMRDKRAREAAAQRGSLKELQSRIDKGDFDGSNNDQGMSSKEEYGAEGQYR